MASIGQLALRLLRMSAVMAGLALYTAALLS
jgi:hypothetical protein